MGKYANFPDSVQCPLIDRPCEEATCIVNKICHAYPLEPSAYSYDHHEMQARGHNGCLSESRGAKK